VQLEKQPLESTQILRVLSLWDISDGKYFSRWAMMWKLLVKKLLNYEKVTWCFLLNLLKYEIFSSMKYPTCWYLAWKDITNSSWTNVGCSRFQFAFASHGRLTHIRLLADAPRVCICSTSKRKILAMCHCSTSRRVSFSTDVISKKVRSKVTGHFNDNKNSDARPSAENM